MTAYMSENFKRETLTSSLCSKVTEKTDWKRSSTQSKSFVFSKLISGAAWSWKKFTCYNSKGSLGN